MNNSIIISSVLLLISCSKTETSTCVCKDNTGKVISQRSHSGDKKSVKQFEDECLRDETTVSQISYSGTLTTTSSTSTPCQLQ